MREGPHEVGLFNQGLFINPDQRGGDALHSPPPDGQALDGTRALELAGKQVLRGTRLIARHKQHIAELRGQGAETVDAESMLDALLAIQRLLEKHLHLQGMRKERGLD